MGDKKQHYDVRNTSKKRKGFALNHLLASIGLGGLITTFVVGLPQLTPSLIDAVAVKKPSVSITAQSADPQPDAVNLAIDLMMGAYATFEIQQADIAADATLDYQMTFESPAPNATAAADYAIENIRLPSEHLNDTNSVEPELYVPPISAFTSFNSAQTALTGQTNAAPAFSPPNEIKNPENLAGSPGYSNTAPPGKPREN